MLRRIFPWPKATDPLITMMENIADTPQHNQVEQYRYRIVRNYSWLKEEMTRDLALRIADELAASVENTNCFISDIHHEDISRCKKRRKAVQKLLKQILYGPATVYPVFMKLLRTREDSFIADKLENTTCSNIELTEFIQLQKSSIDGLVPRPHSVDERFTLNTKDHQILLYYFNDKATLEVLSDYFLSEIFFAIREHTIIYSCAMEEEKRADSLLKTMSKCSIRIREALKVIMTELKMEHVDKCMSWNDSTPTECTFSPDEYFPGQFPRQPTRTLGKGVEEKIVTDPSYLRMAALKDLNLDIEEMETGSIIIRLVPVLNDQWNLLKKKCSSGEIKHFITAVYRKEDIVAGGLYDEGKYYLDVNISLEEIPRDSDSAQETRAIIHLSNKWAHAIKWFGDVQPYPYTCVQDIKLSGYTVTATTIENCSARTFIETNMDILCEEMGVSASLMTFLKMNKIIDNRDETDTYEIASRAGRIKFLLKKVIHKGTEAVERFEQYVRSQEVNVYKDVLAFQSKSKGKQHFSFGRDTKVTNRTCQPFYSATAVLTTSISTIDPSQLELNCTKLLNPRCYFEESEEESEEESDLIKRTQLFSNKVDRLKSTVVLFENSIRTMSGYEDRRRKTIEENARHTLEGCEKEMDLLLRTLERLVQSESESTESPPTIEAHSFVKRSSSMDSVLLSKKLPPLPDLTVSRRMSMKDD